MSGEETTPKLEELAAPVQELEDTEVENVTGGMQLRAKRAELPTNNTSDPTEDSKEGFTFK